MRHSNDKGFTLIELLVVIAIVAILASVIFISLQAVRRKTRDANRLSDMAQIEKALLIYGNIYRSWPGNTDNDCSGWDAGYRGGQGSADSFISPLASAGFFNTRAPGDPNATGNCGGYSYYRYPAGSYGCPSSKGAYYVIGVRDMESSSNPHPQSPGWSCASRNWQGEFDWVTGRYESDYIYE